MHVPDGYLSPQTCAVMGAVMVPVWVVSARQVSRTVKQRDVPLLAIGASFCFLVMMLNVPIPDGTTAHAVGGVIIAILLGRYAATIAVSVALAIQALFFGDGGILAFGANCFNMAFVLPWVGYGVYWLLSGRLSLSDPRRAIFAGVGGYAGLNMAALCGAVELGVQPVLFTATDGTPLYAPFHLAQTIPAMMLAHLVVAGVVEFVLTAGVVAYLQRANLPVLRINHAHVPDGDAADAVDQPEPARVSWRWGWIGLGVLAVLTPLGLLAPGGAFGEDAPANLDLAKYGLASIPAGLNRYHGFWSHSVLGGYGFRDGQNATAGYLMSAVVGLVAIAAVVALGWMVFAMVFARFSGAQRTVEVHLAPENPPAARSTPPTPVWLTRAEVGMCPCGCIGRRRKGSFVSKTIAGTADVARQAIFADEMAAQPGLLQRLDPRTKLLGLVALLLVTSLTHRLPVLVGMYLATLVLARASRVPVWLFVRRVWLFIPIFTALVVLPATLNVITPGAIVVPLGTWFSHELGLTRQGLMGAALLISRVAVSVSLAVLVTFTTSWPQLLAALRSLRVPRMFVTVAAMAHRYIFSLLDSVTDMYQARRARTVKPENLESSRRFVGASAGALFGKASHLTTEVHQAMVARGYRGEVRTLAPPAFRRIDAAAGIVVIAVALTVWEAGHVLAG